MGEMKQMLQCICDQDGGCSSDGFCLTELHGACYSSVTRESGEKQRGCLTETHRQMQCGLAARYEYAIDCCYVEKCNNKVRAQLAPGAPLLTKEQSRLAMLILICLVSTLFILLVGYAAKKLFMWVMERKISLDDSLDASQGHHLLSTLDGRETTSTGVEDTSGSGKGYANLEERKISKDVKYCGERPIGKGRYGEVWKAEWKGKQVAVKVFPSTDCDSFTRESKIYTSLMLRHPNILTFYATDCKSDCDEGTKLLLITAYHQYGSLFEFLQVEKVTLPLALRMLGSVVNGISHLHQGIVATSHETEQTLQKVSIAHRDIKSRNILVKSNLECCIADFGLAVKQGARGEPDFVSERKDYTPTVRVGTRRYMAPEVLDETIEMQDFR